MSYKITYPDPIPKRNSTGFLSPDEMFQRYQWIAKFIEMNGDLRPSYRDIGKGWQVSVTAVKSTIDRMKDMGWIDDIAKNKHGMILKKPVTSFVDLSDLQLPKVSVVITTYERPVSLQRLIDLLEQQKHTNKDDLEIIIMNDGSENIQYEGLDYKGLDVTYVYNNRRDDGLPNVYKLKNDGIRMAENEVVWLLDDDLIIDDHTLFILRSYHAALEGAKPVLCPHTANASEPYHFQNPFQIDAQPEDWDKLRVWSSFAGMSFWKRDWQACGGIDERYNNAMGFADLDFGIKLWTVGCQVMMIDGITIFVEDSETGSHRDRFIHTTRPHHNGFLFMEKWGLEEAAKYGITP